MTSVKDYIYFSNERLPTQHNEVLFNNQFGINFNINFFNKTINLESRYSYNTVSKSSDEILSIPKHHLYSRLYYSGQWFDNSIPVQFGVNAYLLSEYYGNAYEPSLQTFYIQNDFLLERNRLNVALSRAQTLAMKWIVDSALKRNEKTMRERVANEIFDAFNNKGNAVKKREETHKMAEANRAFSHFRW